MQDVKITEFIFDQLKEIISVGKESQAKFIINNFASKLAFIADDLTKPKTNDDAIKAFIAAKNLEGCSSKSIRYYKYMLECFFNNVLKEYYLIKTNDIRYFLSSYKENNKISNVSINNIRGIISAFYSWLEAESFISVNPVKRIKKIKVEKIVKETYSDETIELIKQCTTSIRDLSIIELLASTGMRVGELVNLDISDVDFDKLECIVLGKGNKQRIVYFDIKTKIHLKQYLNERNDKNEALFVSFLKPHNRLQIAGIEVMLKNIGKKLGISKVHPHKFRRTVATKAIDKGMPIEQVQRLLGHSKIDTTLEYAMVDDFNVKQSHRKYLT